MDMKSLHIFVAGLCACAYSVNTGQGFLAGLVLACAVTNALFALTQDKER